MFTYATSTGAGLHQAVAARSVEYRTCDANPSNHLTQVGCVGCRARRRGARVGLGARRLRVRSAHIRREPVWSPGPRPVSRRCGRLQGSRASVGSGGGTIRGRQSRGLEGSARFSVWRSVQPAVSGAASRCLTCWDLFGKCVERHDHAAAQGSTTSMSASSKSRTLRVATAMRRERTIAAIWQSEGRRLASGLAWR